MAAHSNTSIRVRLLFDYPPPAVVDCRMCWLLVDLNACRVVADLESVIREKFDFGRGSILSLFVEGCYLPHTESVYVVRDNDSVRVKVDCLARVNGHSSSPDTFSENVKKRRRDAEEDGLGENTVMKKKKKKKSVETAVRDTVQASGDETHKEPVAKKKKKKKKKKQKKVEEKGPPVVPKPAATPKKTPVKVPKTPPVARSKPQKASSSDASSSSSSEEDKAPRKPAPQKAAPKAPTSAPAASRAPPTTKPTQTKSRPPSSSSSETSDDEAAVVKSTPKPPSITPKGGVNPKAQQASPAQRPADGEQRQAASVAPPPGDDSDSEEEIKLVIRQPAQQPVLGLGARQSPWRGRGHGGRGEGRGGLGEGRGGRGEGRGGRGEGRGGRGEGRGGRGEEVGRGAGRGAARGRGASFGFRYEGAEEPSCRSDQLTNLSAIIQNGAERAPKKDYSCMPLLAAPPQVGQKIAFKLLELTENYTPEVSQYKEGRIVTFDLTTKQIELQLLNGFQAPVEPGKFDLVYQNPDGSESVEYAVVRGSRVTERWDSLLEPRLII